MELWQYLRQTALGVIFVGLGAAGAGYFLMPPPEFRQQIIFWKIMMIAGAVGALVGIAGFFFTSSKIRGLKNSDPG